MKKWKLIFTVLALIAFILSKNVVASTLSGPITNPTTGNIYYLLGSSNWTDAQAEAVLLGGNLVTINDEDEHNWVYDTFSSFDGIERGLWIGLNDADSEGVFKWVSGEESSYTNWYTNEPNNFGGNENYVHMFKPGWVIPDGGLWNDYIDQPRYYFDAYPMNGVVEVASTVPEPTTCLLFMFGLLGLAGLTRNKEA